MAARYFSTDIMADYSDARPFDVASSAHVGKQSSGRPTVVVTIADVKFYMAPGQLAAFAEDFNRTVDALTLEVLAETAETEGVTV